MNNQELAEYKQYIIGRLGALSPFLVNYALGDFSQTIQVPEEEDEFTALLVGLVQMVDDIRETLRENREIIGKLEQAEDKYQNQLDVLQLMFEIAKMFLTLPSDQLDASINATLERIALFVNANRSSLFLLSDDPIEITNTHEWCADPVDTQITSLQQIPFEAFGYHAKVLKNHEVVSIATIHDYPPEAVGELAWVADHGFRSLLFVPLLWRGELKGTLGFYGQVGKQIIWSEFVIALLKVVGDILINALNLKEGEIVLNNRIDELARFNRMAVDREMRMIELKRQVNALSQELGREAPFDLAFVERKA